MIVHLLSLAVVIVVSIVLVQGTETPDMPADQDNLVGRFVARLDARGLKGTFLIVIGAILAQWALGSSEFPVGRG